MNSSFTGFVVSISRSSLTKSVDVDGDGIYSAYFEGVALSSTYTISVQPFNGPSRGNVISREISMNIEINEINVFCLCFSVSLSYSLSHQICNFTDAKLELWFHLRGHLCWSTQHFVVWYHSDLWYCFTLGCVHGCGVYQLRDCSRMRHVYCSHSGPDY